MGYTCEMMRQELLDTAEEYGIAKVFRIGKSVMGRDILCVKIGGGRRKLFLGGAYHGLEYLTAAILTRFVRDYADKITRGGCENDFFGRRACELYNSVTLYAAPMINPDGVDIAVNGIALENEHHRRLIKSVGICDYTREWQANARGVDINHNFNALWQRVLDAPAPTKYGGEYPESEPETAAVADFVRREKPDMLIAFHSQGGEIYYDFNGKECREAKNIAERLALASGYRVCTPSGTAAFGGCKDWFIDKTGGLGFTVEVGHGKNPLPLAMLDDVYPENARLILEAMSIG